MTRRQMLLLAAVVLGALGGAIWLSLWVDERNQRFYQAAEDRLKDWHG